MQEYQRNIWKQQLTERVYNPAKKYWQKKQDKRKLADLDKSFAETAVPIAMLENARNDFFAHVEQVSKGGGGSSTIEADVKTFELIHEVGEAFRAVAIDVASTKQPVSDVEPKALIAILEADDESRRKKLKDLTPVGHVAHHPSVAEIQSIAYSFADPLLDSVTDPTIERYIQVLSHDDAIDAYKQIIARQTSYALFYRRPNIVEHGHPKDKFNKALVGIGAAAVIGLILGGSKIQSR